MVLKSASLNCNLKQYTHSQLPLRQKRNYSFQACLLLMPIWQSANQDWRFEEGGSQSKSNRQETESQLTSLQRTVPTPKWNVIRMHKRLRRNNGNRATDCLEWQLTQHLQDGCGSRGTCVTLLYLNNTWWVFLHDLCSPLRPTGKCASNKVKADFVFPCREFKVVAANYCLRGFQEHSFCM